jgi:outer membrane autotransporter protein
MLPNGMILTPRVSLAWQHSFGDVTPSAALAFASPGSAFVVAGVPLARDSALVEAGVDLKFSAHARVGVSYTGQLAGRVNDQAIRGNLVWNF